jgi:hypothetical protein
MPLIARELGLGDVAVSLALRQQFTVAAALDDAAAIEMTQISSACATVERRWAMTMVVRPSHSVRSASERLLGLGIERRGRFVQEDDRRVFKERSCDGDTLALPTRKLHAMLTTNRVVLAVSRTSQLMELGRRDHRPIISTWWAAVTFRRPNTHVPQGGRF